MGDRLNITVAANDDDDDELLHLYDGHSKKGFLAPAGFTVTFSLFSFNLAGNVIFLFCPLSSAEARNMDFI